MNVSNASWLVCLLLVVFIVFQHSHYSNKLDAAEQQIETWKSSAIANLEAVNKLKEYQKNIDETLSQREKELSEARAENKTIRKNLKETVAKNAKALEWSNTEIPQDICIAVDALFDRMQPKAGGSESGKGMSAFIFTGGGDDTSKKDKN